MSQFYETYKNFRNYLGYSRPLTFEEWLAQADDDKAAFLYVQFFREIQIAWLKTRSPYSEEEDGIEVVLQYLIKNVPLIVADPVRFDARYVYRTIFNCLYCRCNNVKRERDKWLSEQSNIVYSAEEEFDLFDITIDPNYRSHDLERNCFWELIENMGEDTVTVVIKLLGGKGDMIPIKVRNRETGEIEDKFKYKYSKIPKARREQIIAELREALECYKDIFYI